MTQPTGPYTRARSLWLLAGLPLASCLHGHWPESPATDAPTNALALHESAWFATSPDDQESWWQASDGGDAARADRSLDGAAPDGCLPSLVRVVATSSCTAACEAIEVLRNDERLGVLLVADAKTVAHDLPEWAQPPQRPAKEEAQGAQALRWAQALRCLDKGGSKSTLSIGPLHSIWGVFKRAQRQRAKKSGFARNRLEGGDHGCL
jgi:hypothetical protein